MNQETPPNPTPTPNPNSGGNRPRHQIHPNSSNPLIDDRRFVTRTTPEPGTSTAAEIAKMDDIFANFYQFHKRTNKGFVDVKLGDVNRMLSNHPETLFVNQQQEDEGKWYLLPQRIRKTDKGYWKQIKPTAVIANRNGVNMCEKNFLNYYKGVPPTGAITDWIMIEYTTAGGGRHLFGNTDPKFDIYVMCMMYKENDPEVILELLGLNDLETNIPRTEQIQHNDVVPVAVRPNVFRSVSVYPPPPPPPRIPGGYLAWQPVIVYPPPPPPPVQVNPRHRAPIQCYSGGNLGWMPVVVYPPPLLPPPPPPPAPGRRRNLDLPPVPAHRPLLLPPVPVNPPPQEPTHDDPPPEVNLSVPTTNPQVTETTQPPPHVSDDGEKVEDPPSSGFNDDDTKDNSPENERNADSNTTTVKGTETTPPPVHVSDDGDKIEDPPASGFGDDGSKDDTPENERKGG